MRRFCLAALLCSICFSPFVFAEQEIIISSGKGLNNALIQQKSIASAEMIGINYSYLFFDYPDRHRWQWWVQGSYSRMREEHQGETQHQNIFELKPVLRWYPQRDARGFFAETGIGAAYLTNQSFGAIDLTTKLNFSLHFAGGYRFPAGSTLSLRYSHFSNGYTNTPNPGFDFASVNLHFVF